MGTQTIAQNQKLLEATEERFRKFFQVGQRATESASPLAAGTPRHRHLEVRSRWEPRSATELLRSNPKDLVEGRLRRIGLPEEQVKAVTGGQVDSVLEASSNARGIGLERIIGRNELLAVRYLDGGLRASRAVGRV